MDAPIQIIRVSIIAILCVVLPVFLSSCATQSSYCNFEPDKIAKIKKEAELGDAQQQYTLGTWYQYGECVKLNLAMAMDWYQRSALQGNIESQFRLAFLYDHHKDNKNQAIEWYKKAALQGDTKSMRRLGVIYVNGIQVEKNIDEGKKWFTLAAEQDDLLSIGYLVKYSTDNEAVKWKAKKEYIISKEDQKLTDVEKRKRALELFGSVGIAWLPVDPSFLKDKSTYKSPSEASDAEARGYLYAPIALVSWPAWLLTAVVGESGVAAKKSTEHTYMQNTVRKAFDESNIQTFFIENLIEAANKKLDNPVRVLEKYEETERQVGENSANTILELRNGLVKIIENANHRYSVLIELEYKTIDNETQNVLNQKSIKAWGKRFTRAKSSDSGEEEEINSKLARESLELAYQKLANSIIESVLELP